jgi:nucleotide-binding universal stress UspA family protein
LERATRELADCNLAVTLALPEERAAAAIVRHVEEQDVDLVVVATRSHSDFENDFDARKLGTVSMALVRRSPSEVWAARPDRAAIPQRLLAATDLGDEVGRAVVHRAAAIAGLFDAELHLVHAPQLSWTKALSSDARRAAELDRLAAKAEQWMQREAEAAGQGSRAILHVPRTAAYLAVAEISARVDADLVVMGSVSRGGIADKLLGNTAERILGTLDRSLLVLKPARVTG